MLNSIGNSFIMYSFLIIATFFSCFFGSVMGFWLGMKIMIPTLKMLLEDATQPKE